MVYLILILGLASLVVGANYFVEGSANLAKRFSIPTAIIGLTIVALGTSLPEASVSITAALQAKNTLAISNVVGSNIFNILVVIGVSCWMVPFVMDADIVRRDLKINVLISILLLGLLWVGNCLSRIDGVILLIILVFYLWTLMRSAKTREQEENKPNSPIWLMLVQIVGGLACIILGGNWVVNSASDIARAWGISETLIGLTIVSIGTSLPELVTSVVAAKKGESSLSLGNAIGSNILNIMFILGVSSLLSPISVLTDNLWDSLVMVGVAALLVLYASKRTQLTRLVGMCSVGLYAIYMIYIIMR